MKIETLAQLKRIPVGTKLRLVHSLVGPTPEGKQLRTVLRVQTNAMVSRVEEGPKSGTESWLHFPKAAEFRATPGGFTIYEGAEIAAQYVIVNEGA